MTLVITVLTPKTIYQSADFRLSDFGSNQPLPTPSTKLVSLLNTAWTGFVSYTGVGKWDGKDTSEFIIEWLTGFQSRHPSDTCERLKELGAIWLNDIAARDARRRHSFILSAFDEAGSYVATISNFENCFGKKHASDDAGAKSVLEITSRRPLKNITVIVNGGITMAGGRLARERLERHIAVAPDDSERVRHVLADINKRASEKTAGISPDCSVVSMRADGSGVYDSKGNIQVLSLWNGHPFPFDIIAIAKKLAGGPVQLVGSTFATSRKRVPFEPCSPQIVYPTSYRKFDCLEIVSSRHSSMFAFALNNRSEIAGHGALIENRSEQTMWKRSPSGEMIFSDFLGNAGDINNSGVVAGGATVVYEEKKATNATTWLPPQSPVNHGISHNGIDSSIRAISDNGISVGWISIDKNNRGQESYRPAAWGSEKSVTSSAEWDWGEAIDVTENGIVLVCTYKGPVCRPFIWKLDDGSIVAVGGAGIFPAAINATETVLGTSYDLAGDAVSLILAGKGSWRRLFEEGGYYATAINGNGDITGSRKIENYERPWLLHHSGELSWLPYFRNHHCRPWSINEKCEIVGHATTDHGSHALLWTPRN